MKNKKGFTLAEILITLVVVGVIASITISIINSNIRKAEIETKLKRNYSILNLALYRSISDYGPANTWKAYDPHEFANKYLLPNLIITNPPKDVSIKELGYNKPITQPNGETAQIVGNINSSNRRIFLNDGTIILHSVKAVPESDHSVTAGMHYYIDINGSKGPNIIGKDIFIFNASLLEEVPTVKMDMILQVNVIDNNGTKEIKLSEYERSIQLANCRTQGHACGALIQKNGWKIPKDYPIKI